MLERPGVAVDEGWANTIFHALPCIFAFKLPASKWKLRKRNDPSLINDNS